MANATTAAVLPIAITAVKHDQKGNPKMLATLHFVPVTNQLKKAIAAKLKEGVSLRQISIDSGVEYSSLFRFVKDERSLTGPAIDRLAEYFGLRLCSDDE